MHHVGHIAGRLAPGTKAKIAVVAARELVAVEAKVNMPDQIARVASHETEDGVQNYSRTPAKCANGEPYAVRAENVGRDEVECGTRFMASESVIPF